MVGWVEGARAAAFGGSWMRDDGYGLGTPSGVEYAVAMRYVM